MFKRFASFEALRRYIPTRRARGKLAMSMTLVLIATAIVPLAVSPFDVQHPCCHRFL